MPMKIINVKFQDEEIEMIEDLKKNLQKKWGGDCDDEQAIKLILAFCADLWKKQNTLF